MGHKVVTLIKHEPALQTVFAEYIEKDKSFLERANFLENSMKKLHEDRDAAVKILLEFTEKTLVDAGTIQPLAKDESIHIDKADGSVCVCKQETNQGLLDFIRGRL